MKKKGLEPSHDEHVNVTPLIDVVMCLIIFFMVCGKLAKDEAGDVNVPIAKLGQELGDARNRLTISLVPRPNSRESDMPILLVGGKEKNYDDLTEFLRKEVGGNKDVKLVIRADLGTQYQYVAPVLISCTVAGIKSVHFSTKPEG